MENGIVHIDETSGGNVNRNLVSVAIAALALAGALLAQEPANKTQDPATKTQSKKTANDGAAVTRGKEIFEKKCALCHYADSDAKKIGPGLKGLSKRGTFTVKDGKVTDESLKEWIENGDTQMPPFKDVLEPTQIKDVIAYVKTL
jgi:cytochrome c